MFRRRKKQAEPHISETHFKQGEMAFDRRHWQEAIARFRDAIDAAMASPPLRPKLATRSWVMLADCHRLNGNSPEAHKALAEAAQLIQQFTLFGSEAQIRHLAALSILRREQGDFAAASRLREEIVEMHRKSQPNGLRSLPAVLDAVELAKAYCCEGRVAQAQATINDVTAALSKVPPAADPEANKRISAVIHEGLAHVFLELGKYFEAQQLALRAISIYDSILLKDSVRAAGARKILMQARILLDTMDEKELRALMEENSGDAVKAGAANSLGMIELKNSRFEEAEKWFRQELELSRGLGADPRPIAIATNNVAVALREQGKLQEAENLQLEALEFYQKHFGPEHPHFANGLKNLALLRQRQGKTDEAREIANRAIQIGERALGKAHPQMLRMRESLESVIRQMHG